MDCFYAQCETVRLGLPQSLPLCLIQWNSVLAVNYPAREKFDIRRMDSLQVVREKSLKQRVADDVGGDGESNDNNDSSSSEKNTNKNDGVEEEEGCVCIHLPVMKVNDNNNNSSQNNTQQQQHDNEQQDYNNNDDDDDNLNNTISAYNTEFNQPPHIQHKMYLSERNVMRSPSEGKANLDRYRLASARIFGLIDDTLGELLAGIKTADNSDCGGHNGAEESKGHTKSGYVLERASIDELFIDVTEFCYDILERERLKKKNKKKKSEECCKEQVGDNDDVEAQAEAEAAADNDDTKQIKRVEFQRNCLVDSITSLKESVVCHQNRIPPSYIQQRHNNGNDDDDDDAKALQIGCHIAHTISPHSLPNTWIHPLIRYIHK